MTKRIVTAFGIGAALTLLLVGLFVAETETVQNPPAFLRYFGYVLFWPVTACTYLVGPGPNIGTPEKPIHEGTLVQLFAIAVGIALTWVFYSGLAFFIFWLRQRRRINGL
jgi:hypothetical protein